MWNDSGPDLQTRAHRREAALLFLAFVFLVLFSLGLTLSSAARVQDWSVFPGNLGHMILLPIWGIGAWLLHREANLVAPDRDPYLLPIGLLLAGWGNLIIWRLNPTFGGRQTLWFALACLLVTGLYRLNPRLTWLRDYRYLWMTLALMLLGFTLFFGTNPLGGEPRLWLGCCGVYFQPSEPLRFFLVAFVASFLADRLRLNQSIGKSLRWFDYLPLMLVWGVSILFLIVQRDLGTGMIFLALLAALLYLATGSWQVLLISAVFAILGAVVSYFLFGVVQVRVQAWINPWLDPTGASYQIVQSLISIASGGVFGRGPGLGSPGFVPASHTDFIYAALVEEFGLVGGIAIVALFAILVSRGLQVAVRHRDVFSRFLAAGLALTIGVQALFIIGGVMRALPLVGITLPFVSYGGSSLLTSFASLAILVLLSQKERVEALPLRAIDPVQIGFSLAWCGLALITGWWTIYRGVTLTERTDNPRRALDTRFVERGMIFDRHGNVLAQSVGTAGSFERFYPHTESAPITGFDSPQYGQSGIESQMDRTLRGLERGSLLQNLWQQTLAGHPPEGEDIQLTLDIELQSLAMDALEERVGAAVLLEARSGELYVIATSPSFDPNQLQSSWSELINADEAPLFNRATQGMYQPGMTMAPFIFAQGAGNSQLRPESPVTNLTSPVEVDGERLSCSQTPLLSAGPTLMTALRYGCPGPVQEVAMDLGREMITDTIDSFGFTQPVDISLATADSMTEPVGESEDAIANLAIGQGDLRVSPVQMARSYAGLLAGEEIAPLLLVRAVNEDDDGWVERESAGYRVPPLSPGVRKAVKDIYASDQPNLYAVRAEAISGAGGQILGWYLGGIDTEEALWIVVVVLEDNQPSTAEIIGRTILAAAAGSLSP